MDTRYQLVPSDNKTRGDYMIVKEMLPDGGRTHRDRDFDPLYFVVYAAAEAKLEELDKELP